MTNSPIFLIDTFASRALYYELHLSPKPGLVDCYTNGAHYDMNFQTFIDSIFSLTPYFKQYVQAGLQRAKHPIEHFERARTIGIQAEKSMLKATQGINTHKGANFSFAIILTASAHILTTSTSPYAAETTNLICDYAKKMTTHLIAQDFNQLNRKTHLTHGEKLYLTHGITGIRGEAAAGYPALTQLLMPFIRHCYRQEMDIKTTWLKGLALLMSQVEDSNLIHRGGLSACRRVQNDMQQLIHQEYSDSMFKQKLQQYDQHLIQQHLSPGGAADLLALGFYFAQLEHLPLSV